MSKVLTEQEAQRLIDAINRDYITKQELIDDLDNLMYVLFFVDKHSVKRRTQRDLACMLKRLKDSISSD